MDLTVKYSDTQVLTFSSLHQDLNTDFVYIHNTNKYYLDITIS